MGGIQCGEEHFLVLISSEDEMHYLSKQTELFRFITNIGENP